MKTILYVILGVFVAVCGGSQTHSTEQEKWLAPAQTSAGSANDAQTIEITRNGSHSALAGPARYFTGSVQVDQ